jgi:uncharacterized protein (DUF1778 family)
MAKRPRSAKEDDEALNETITVRANSEDVALWDRAAKKDGRKRANWARRVLTEAAKKQLAVE